MKWSATTILIRHPDHLLSVLNAVIIHRPPTMPVALYMFGDSWPMTGLLVSHPMFLVTGRLMCMIKFRRTRFSAIPLDIRFISFSLDIYSFFSLIVTPTRITRKPCHVLFLHFRLFISVIVPLFGSPTRATYNIFCFWRRYSFTMIQSFISGSSWWVRSHLMPFISPTDVWV